MGWLCDELERERCIGVVIELLQSLTLPMPLMRRRNKKERAQYKGIHFAVQE